MIVMKNKKLVWIIGILAIIIAWYLVSHSRSQTSSRPEAITNAIAPTSPVIQVPASNSAATQPQVSVRTGDSDRDDVITRYHQGLLTKEQAMQTAVLGKNELPQDFYGKVIDQFGQPIPGVSITGQLVFNTDIDGGIKTETHTTQTDSQGLFQFTGLHGASLNVRPEKDGYKYGDRGEGLKGPAGSMAGPTDRAVLTMWKLRGAEPLTSFRIDAKIPYDGSPTTFETATGKESPNGDLKVTLSRAPLQVHRSGQGFDWAVKIEMLDGGLIEENDPYPYWAPESGYRPSFEFNMSSNSVPWNSTLEDSFYLKNSGGQFGRMQVGVYGAATPARLQINFTINPSGSQNLEPADLR
jgi:hypothetical protein